MHGACDQTSEVVLGLPKSVSADKLKRHAKLESQVNNLKKEHYSCAHIPTSDATMFDVITKLGILKEFGKVVVMQMFATIKKFQSIFNSLEATFSGTTLRKP